MCERNSNDALLEVIFLVDISSSIAPKVANGMGGLWTWLNSFTKRFDFKRQSKMALITFNKDTSVEASLGHYNQNEIDQIMLNTLSDIKPIDESSLNFALKTARKEFKHNGMPEADKAIVLVTDGWSTDTNTPYYHSSLAVREGIDIYTVGFGPVLNKEYLYTTTMGKEENIHAAADLTGLHTTSLMLQEQICNVDMTDVMYNQAIWQRQRYDVNPQLYSAMGGRYDKSQTIDLNRVKSLELDFDSWFVDEAEYGIQADMRRMNITDIDF